MSFDAIVARRRRGTALAAAAAAALLLGGCGGSGGSASTGQTASTSGPAPAKGKTASNRTATRGCGSSTASGSTSEAAATSQGDIPDNQQFLVFRNPAGGYSISYPEGWARSGRATQVTFIDKSNTISIRVVRGSHPTPASVAGGLKREASSDPCLVAGKPRATTAGPNRVVKVTYTTSGKRSPVTGKRPRITVDRYVYFRNGKVATVDLATPLGVDNVDAYRMISQSYRWG
ncbi:MAG: hypothetical protein U0R52_11760 [Solirubrobacterales bacterium]